VVPTPLLDFFKRGEVDRDVRLQAAQGTFAPRAHEQLAILVLLLDDPDREIRETADETLNKIPVEALEKFLARSDVPVDLREFFGDRGIFPSEIPPIEVEIEEPLIDTSIVEGEADEERLSGTQELAAMNFPQRLKAALKGTREHRAILIRDCLFDEGQLGASAATWLNELEPFFRSYAATNGTVSAYGDLLKLLLTRWKCHVEGEAALAELVRLVEPEPDRLLIEMPPAGYDSCVEGLIVAGRYERALQLLRQHNFDVAEQKGPLHMLILDRWSYAQAGFVSPDAGTLRAFFEAHRAGLGDEERGACETQLAKLEAL